MYEVAVNGERAPSLGKKNGWVSDLNKNLERILADYLPLLEMGMPPLQAKLKVQALPAMSSKTFQLRHLSVSLSSTAPRRPCAAPQALRRPG